MLARVRGRWEHDAIWKKKKKKDKHTFPGLVGAEITIGDQAHRLACLDCEDTNYGLKIALVNKQSQWDDCLPKKDTATTYLNHKQQKVEVKVQARQNILVHHGHQNGGTAVCQHRKSRIVGYR